jgi:hypothetical protein
MRSLGISMYGNGVLTAQPGQLSGADSVRALPVLEDRKVRVFYLVRWMLLRFTSEQERTVSSGDC